jgi:predicted  nucleic acid-binding Zn-ribbon protein
MVDSKDKYESIEQIPHLLKGITGLEDKQREIIAKLEAIDTIKTN